MALLNRIIGVFFIALALLYSYAIRHELFLEPAYDTRFFFNILMIAAMVYLGMRRIRKTGS